MPDPAEAVAVHPGIAAERERWWSAHGCYDCKAEGWYEIQGHRAVVCPACVGRGYINFSPPILLLPAVPPAELRVGDVVKVGLVTMEYRGSGVVYDIVATRELRGPAVFRSSRRLDYYPRLTQMVAAGERLRVLREAQT